MSQIASVIGGEARCAMSCAMSHSFGLAAGCIAADLGFCFVFGLVWFVFFSEAEPNRGVCLSWQVVRRSEGGSDWAVTRMW